MNVKSRATIAILCLMCIENVSCASLQSGILYTHVKGPVAVTAEANAHGFNGVGEASAIVVLGLVTLGDASIEAAKRQGSAHPELVSVTHVDYECRTVLGTGRVTVRVYFHDPTVRQ